MPLTYRNTDGIIMAMQPTELKQWRAENGYTQGELAKILGVAEFTVSRWESRMREIPPFLHLALKAIPKKRGKSAAKRQK